MAEPAVVDFREILAEGIRLVVDSVSRIDAAGRSVVLASGGCVRCDHLIDAVGIVGTRGKAPRPSGARAASRS